MNQHIFLFQATQVCFFFPWGRLSLWAPAPNIPIVPNEEVRLSLARLKSGFRKILILCGRLHWVIFNIGKNSQALARETKSLISSESGTGDWRREGGLKFNFGVFLFCFPGSFLEGADRWEFLDETIRADDSFPKCQNEPALGLDENTA